MKGTSVVEIRGLVKVFGDRKAVDGLELDILPGECLALLGPNGAGKTTTIHMLLGLVRPTSGSLRVFGKDLYHHLRHVKQRIGVVPQMDNLDPDLTVLENLLTYASYFNIPRRTALERSEELLGFFALANRSNDIIQHLSGGQRRRLLLARALVNNPELLILDEPTIGLDPQARHLMWERLHALRAQGTTMLLTTHYMEEVGRLASRVLVMDSGKKVAFGRPDELVSKVVGIEVYEVADGTSQLKDLEESLKDCHVETELVDNRLYVYVHRGCEALDQMVSSYPRLVRRPANLEDLFLRLTGRKLRED